ncbi:molybdate ABC transporter substrate-binding protein [Calothrix sp. FACHB-156]|nr:molybdate ABC transporter substrate-binding protein [Calothrix sp. FACHB-156]
MSRRRILVLIGTAVASLLVSTVLSTVHPTPVVAQGNVTLLVFADTSLTNALEELKPTYQQNKPNININYNFGASGALQQLIEQGAPADIFISAAKKQVDAVEQKGLLVAGTRTIVAKNRLVLVVPKNVVGVTSFDSLKDGIIKKIAIGDPRSEPSGQYAEQVLGQLNILLQVKSKLVYVNNVRQVLASVESGNADAGLVYATDAKISNKVKVVVVADEKYHSPIIYPVAVLKGSKNADAAKDFVQFLSSSQAKAFLERYGFILP